jgi:Zn-finger nucleic acid-binding protein
MTKCPIHNTEMTSIEDGLITGKTANVDYCEKCHDTYIPEKELKKYQEVKELKRKLAKALSTDHNKINIQRSDNKIIIYQTF